MLNADVSIYTYIHTYIYIYIYIKDPCLYSNSSTKHQCLAKLKLTYRLNCCYLIGKLNRQI